jgi:hypothetical protein
VKVLDSLSIAAPAGLAKLLRDRPVGDELGCVFENFKT